jgi:hypothetical protein
MKQTKVTLSKKCIVIFQSVFVACLFAASGTFAQSNNTAEKPAQIGSSKTWGTVDGIALTGLVQGPSSASAPLQVACVFEYTEGDIFNAPPALPAPLNGMVHLDHALDGIITDIRKSGKFKGLQNETILITPPNGTMSAPKLLLIGLGKRENFTPEIMVEIGTIATREALRLGVESFAFASDIKDAGIDSPTAPTAGNVVKGIIEAYRTQCYLKSKHMAQYTPLKQVYLLAGPNFFNIAGKGIEDAISTLKN